MAEPAAAKEEADRLVKEAERLAKERERAKIKPCSGTPFKVTKARFDAALAREQLVKVTSHSMVAKGDCVVWRMGSNSSNHEGGSAGEYVSSVVTERGGDSDSDYVKVRNLDGSSSAPYVCVKHKQDSNYNEQSRGCVYSFRITHRAHGHSLKSIVTGGWNCDVCKKRGLGSSDVRWRCKDGCDWDCCQTCMAKLHSTPPKAGSITIDGLVEEESTACFTPHLSPALSTHTHTHTPLPPPPHTHTHTHARVRRRRCRPNRQEPCAGQRRVRTHWRAAARRANLPQTRRRRQVARAYKRRVDDPGYRRQRRRQNDRPVPWQREG